MNTYLTKVLITGGSGQLASALRYHPKAKHYEMIFCPKEILDITDRKAVLIAIQTYAPQIVINTAAYTAVEQAETATQEAMHINHEACMHLAMACQQFSIPIIHISTDYIFDGLKSSPYHEDDAVNPQNHYGLTKWLGEEAIRAYCEKHLILRVSGIFSEYGNNFLKTIWRIAQEKKICRVVCDQITCPTYALDIAHTIFILIEKLSHFGTYHYCSTEAISWYHFAEIIVRLGKHYQPCLLEELIAITAEVYQAPAKRPAYSVLGCNKIYQHYGISQPSLKTGAEQAIVCLTT